MKLISSLVLVAGLLSAASAQAAIERPFGERSVLSKTATAERLAPTAKVCIEGDSCGAKAAAVTVVAAAEPLTGEQIYQNNCMACHTTGAAGAPKLGDAADWKARLTAAGSVDKLTASAIAGKNAMPAKGMCMTCSDADIKNTVQYILDHSK
jgi:hypothetical protein